MSKIQLIAHHEIQAQVFQGIVPLLVGHECLVSIGQDVSIDSDTDIVVLADHFIFQKNLNPKGNYHLVHLSHDIADMDIYKVESNSLRHFNLILCPSESHLTAAKENLPFVTSFNVGWQKSVPFRSIDFKFEEKERTIILAPTEIADFCWRPIVEGLLNSNYKILFKNHVYWNFEDGDAPPRGQEELYMKHRIQLEEIEKYVDEINSEDLILVDRRSNIREIFPEAFLLITDCSSAAAEFQAFGIAIELGILDSQRGKRVPEISLNFSGVYFMEEEEMLRALKNSEFSLEIEKFTKTEGVDQVPFQSKSTLEPDQISAFLINNLAFQYQKRPFIFQFLYFKSLLLQNIKSRFQKDQSTSYSIFFLLRRIYRLTKKRL